MTVDRVMPAGPNAASTHENVTSQTDFLPGFELSLARLLAVADRWDKKRRGRTTDRRKGERTDG